MSTPSLQATSHTVFLAAPSSANVLRKPVLQAIYQGAV